jgi:predicted dehydrogenase
VGFGKVAELAHLPALSACPELTLAAVVEPLPARRDLARALLPGVRVYEDLAGLLMGEADLDFVDLCTPPHSHARLALAALKRGLHVLSEKPLSLSPAEFRELEEAWAPNPALALVTVHNWRYAPILAQTTALIRGGAIGRVQQVEWQVYRTDASGGGLSPWRRDPAHSLGGILVDHGWHAFYLLPAWLGRPEALRARLVREPGSPVELEAEVEMKFPGAAARLFFTWQAAQRANRARILGQAGEIIIDDDHLTRTAGEEILSSPRFPEKLSGGSHHPEWMAGVLREFLQEIQTAHQRGRNFLEAETCSRLIRLAYRSHESGGALLPLAP